MKIRVFIGEFADSILEKYNPLRVLENQMSSMNLLKMTYDILNMEIGQAVRQKTYIDLAPGRNRDVDSIDYIPTALSYYAYAISYDTKTKKLKFVLNNYTKDGMDIDKVEKVIKKAYDFFDKLFGEKAVKEVFGTLGQLDTQRRTTHNRELFKIEVDSAHRTKEGAPISAKPNTVITVEADRQTGAWGDITPISYLDLRSYSKALLKNAKSFGIGTKYGVATYIYNFVGGINNSSIGISFTLTLNPNPELVNSPAPIDPITGLTHVNLKSVMDMTYSLLEEIYNRKTIDLNNLSATIKAMEPLMAYQSAEQIWWRYRDMVKWIGEFFSYKTLNTVIKETNNENDLLPLAAKMVKLAKKFDMEMNVRSEPGSIVGSDNYQGRFRLAIKEIKAILPTINKIVEGITLLIEGKDIPLEAPELTLLAMNTIEDLEADGYESVVGGYFYRFSDTRRVVITTPMKGVES